MQNILTDPQLFRALDRMIERVSRIADRYLSKKKPIPQIARKVKVLRKSA